MILAALCLIPVLECAAQAVQPARMPSSPDPQQSAGENEAAGGGLEHLIVTASRIPVPAQAVGSSVTVISGAELELRQSMLVAEALREVPGLAVSRGGGFGAVTQVRIRGTEGNHALVLIDGVEANNPVSNSEFDFANLLVGDIERIEVLRGPQSALYGSDAVGGVISVITRERDDGVDARILAEAGSLATRSLAFSINGGDDARGGGFRVARLRTDGENIARRGEEKDGFETESLSLHGRTRVGEALRLQAKLHHIDSEQAFDTQDFSFPSGPTQGLVIDDDVSSRLEQWFGRAEANAVRSRAAHRVGISSTRTQNRFFDGNALTGRNEGEKTKLDYQVTLDLADHAEAGGPAGSPHALTLALERERIAYRNAGATTDAPENQIRREVQASAVAEYRRSFGRGAFSASARFDDNRLFDDASAWRLTGAYTFNTRTRLHSSLGTGVSNPGFFELFGFFPGSFVGNPSLRPEHSRSFDVGIERNLGSDLLLDVTYFVADLTDEIQTTFDPQSFLSTVVNLPGESERRGLELRLAASPIEGGELIASYTYTDAEQPDGTQELRRPRHLASLTGTLRLLGGRGRLHVGVDHTGAQLDTELVFATPEERVVLPSFTLVNVAGELDLAPRVRLRARIDNAFDEVYEEWFSYRGRGRTFTAGIAVDLLR